MDKIGCNIGRMSKLFYKNCDNFICLEELDFMCENCI